MSVRIAEDRELRVACLYDSTSGIAFGPTFSSSEDAERFLDSLNKDARLYSSDQLALRAARLAADDE